MRKTRFIIQKQLRSTSAQGKEGELIPITLANDKLSGRRQNRGWQKREGLSTWIRNEPFNAPFPFLQFLSPFYQSLGCVRVGFDCFAPTVARPPHCKIAVLQRQSLAAPVFPASAQTQNAKAMDQINDAVLRVHPYRWPAARRSSCICCSSEVRSKVAETPCRVS